MAQILKDFKTFLLRGNVVDLAVAVVIGTVFAALVAAFVSGILTPIIAMIFGEPSFAALDFEINDAEFKYGLVLDAAFTFITTAAAIYFFVVAPMNVLIARARREPPADPTTKKCPECISEIPIQARRCAFCTSELAG
ncbi:MAG: large conductance mechanosensitive channel protein MscL [Dehalococcoidia bacterium]|nr:large conductance mechanosensitive channel protein MscL [Dehalococcoidia bacterium]